MKKNNIYRSDDVLLIMGRVFAIILFFPILFTTIYLLVEEVNIGAIIGDVIMISIPVILITMGKRIRQEENKILAVFNILIENPEVFVSDIENSTQLSKDEIISNLKIINMRRLGYFVYDSESNSIINGRLRRKNIVVQNCPGCGKLVNLNIALNLADIPKCNYCNNPIDIDYLNKEKNKIIDEIIGETKDLKFQKDEKKFSVIVLILLLIFFWPGAIAYIIIKTRKKRN